MHPWLWPGPAAPPTWALALSLAAVLHLAVLRREALRDGLRPRQSLDSAWWVLPAAWIGARLGDLLLGSGPSSLSTSSQGASLYGAALGGGLSALLWARWKAREHRSLLDHHALAASAALPLARLGCLAAGCCYGRSTGALGLRSYARGAAGEALRGVSLHPVALYEAVYSVLIFALLSATRRRRPAGRTAALAAVLYSGGRLLLDPLRHPAARGRMWGDLSASQLAAGLTLLLGLAWLFHSARARGREAG